MLISIVHELRKASGRNAKIKILEGHKRNEKWLRFLKATYDGTISYGVSAPSSPDFDTVEINEEMFEVLSLLANREVTGNEAKMAAKFLSTKYGEIPRLVLGRSIKAGISVTTINNVYGNLIPVFLTMKGKDVPVLEYPVLSSVKYDGCKTFATVTSDGVVLQTSSGGVFRLKSLEEELSRASHGVYEGELIHKDGKQVDRPIITGMLNSLISGTKLDLPLDDYSFGIYDWIPLIEWQGIRNPEVIYADRQKHIKTLVSLDVPDSAVLFHINQLLIDAKKDLEWWTNDLIEQGYEGSMSRYLQDVYMFTGDKRTDRLIKKKANREATLLCIGTTPHSNPSKGVTGSLHLKGSIDGIEVDVNVGSGLTKWDIQRGEEYYIGRMVEVIYNTITETDSGHSLFLPRFKRIVNIEKR